MIKTKWRSNDMRKKSSHFCSKPMFERPLIKYKRFVSQEDKMAFDVSEQESSVVENSGLYDRDHCKS